MSLSSDSSPKSAVRNGGGGRGSASEEEDGEEESSPQQSAAAQTQSECYNITPQIFQMNSFVELCLCTDPGWTASFGETEVSSSSSWGGSPQQGGEGPQDASWASFTEFQPLSR